MAEEADPYAAMVHFGQAYALGRAPTGDQLTAVEGAEASPNEAFVVLLIVRVWPWYTEHMRMRWARCKR